MHASPTRPRWLRVDPAEAVGRDRTVQVYWWSVVEATSWEPHHHPEHELLAAVDGSVHVMAHGRAWAVPLGTGLFLPAGVEHVVSTAGPARFICAYFRAARSPLSWASPTAVGVDLLLRELLRYLDEDSASDGQRDHAERLVVGLIRPTSEGRLHIALPTDPRARHIADRIVATPSDSRTLDEWADVVGASVRTLARVFAAETGMSFTTWRRQARVQASYGLLAAGHPVNAVSRRVGYRTPSAFISAFQRTTGATPGAYLARQPSGLQ